MTTKSPVSQIVRPVSTGHGFLGKTHAWQTKSALCTINKDTRASKRLQRPFNTVLVVQESLGLRVCSSNLTDRTACCLKQC